jgi:DNA-binding Lrp family transcriptional regulator
MFTKLDKKILFSLDEDGRKSYTKIAKELNTTPQVVKYRLENLLEKKIIKNF